MKKKLPFPLLPLWQIIFFECSRNIVFVRKKYPRTFKKTNILKIFCEIFCHNFINIFLLYSYLLGWTFFQLCEYTWMYKDYFQNILLPGHKGYYNIHNILEYFFWTKKNISKIFLRYCVPLGYTFRVKYPHVRFKIK